MEGQHFIVLRKLFVALVAIIVVIVYNMICLFIFHKKSSYLGFAFRKLPSIYVFSYFSFGFESRMWDLIAPVPDHCLSFYFVLPIVALGE